MKKYINVGRIDQISRISFSLIIFYITLIDDNFIEDSVIKFVLIVIASLNFIVSSIRICPLYKLAGITTCYIKKNINDN